MVMYKPACLSSIVNITVQFFTADYSIGANFMIFRRFYNWEPIRPLLRTIFCRCGKDTSLKFQ